MKVRKINLINLTLIIYVFCAIAADEGSIVMKAARLLLIGVFFLYLLCRKKVRICQYLISLFTFFLFATFSITWAESKEYAFTMTKTLLINALCMCSLFNLIADKQKRIDIVLNCFVIAPLLLEIRVIISSGVFAFLDSRLAGTINGNTIGLCAAFGGIVAIYYWIQNKDRGFYTFFLGVNILITILSASRKALFCICIPVGILYVSNRKDALIKHIGKLIFLAFVGILGYFAIMYIPILYDLIGSRIEGMFKMIMGYKSIADASSASRFKLISWGIEWFKQRPWLGYGIDNYRIVLVKHHPDWPIEYYAHNNYVELLVDVGIIGLVLYYWNYIAILIQSIKYRKYINNKNLLIIGILFALMISEYAIVTYYDKYIQIFLLMIWIIMGQTVRKLENTRNR